MAAGASLRLDDSARIGDAERADGPARCHQHGTYDDYLVEGVHRGAVGGERVSDERARGNDPGERDSHESCDTGDRVVDGRGDSRIRLVRVGEHRRVAFFAILVTGRYPRGIFDFNVGVLRWTWRVAFYSYGALGTDRYPPFTLDDVPDYPARLDIPYPAQLSRGLVLVKWWLLAIPHYLIVAIFLGGGSYAAARVDDWFWTFGFETGLIGVLVLFAGIALLFIGNYPRGMFDSVLGLDRWVARVAAYVLLMRDEYPPFRLDQGGADPWVVVDYSAAPAVPAEQPTPVAAPAEAPPGRGTAARVALIVVGVVVGIVAFALLAGGCALVAVDQTQRDDDGFLMSPTQDFASPTYAIVSESADIDSDGGEWALDAFLGTVRIRSESERPLFVGIGPAAEVDRYLDGVERDVVDDLDSSGDPEYARRPGGAPSSAPGTQAFWAASSSGAGEQTLEWEPEDGDWRAVVMNEDASRNITADMSIGAELDSVLWIGIGLLVMGALLAGGAALAITAGARRRRSLPA
ncbi:MAG TPA: DUF4389 domain-containing protein [Gaiellaceae bacterium]|nr:DUF4389 domain-containing protein [Gaiellaceae bacterium]